MTKEQLVEYNKLCALFLGATVNTTSNKDFHFYEGVKLIGNKICAVKTVEEEWISVNTLKFDSDWNWIMIVVEKIETTYDEFHGYFGVHISSNGCVIQGTKLRTNPENPHYAYFANHTEPSKKEAVFSAIYNFLNWYNNECKTN